MICSICSKDFSNSDLNKFIIHLEYAHSMRYNYDCPICRRSFSRRDNFKNHLRTQHNNSTTTDTFLKNDSNIPTQDEMQISSESNNEISEEPIFVFDADAKAKEFENIVKESVLHLIATLHNEISIPRSFIQKIIDLISKFLNAGFLSILKEFMLPSDCLTNIQKAKDLIDFLAVCFEPLDTEYKRLQFFYRSKKYIEPQLKIIGSSWDVSNKNNKTSMILKNRTCTFIPVSETLNKFLALPGTLKYISEYMTQSYASKNSDNSIYNNLLNGSLWEEVLQNSQGKAFIPLILYFDDFETSNPLGSHAGVYKVGVVYFSIAALPPQYISRLENIFPCLIFHSSERTEFGNEAIFNCLLEDLKSLESNGIIVNNLRLYFNVILLVGDNLGVNSVLGFVESFSANYFCRFCITSKTVTQYQPELDLSNNRLRFMYDQHVKNKEYGVKEYCIWNGLNYFHVYNNQSLDIMHDLYEGIHRYDMAQILKVLLQSEVFTLETLNSRVKYFKYEFCEKNHPPVIKKEHIEKGMLILSSSEMETFVKNFRYFVGDLVPINNNAWLVYLQLLKITEILSQTKISSSCITLLDTLIPKYLSELKKVFPHITLKPKHHLLLHYTMVLRKIGPVSKISCERFEAKHRELKKIANNVSTRKNIPLTLAKKCQMQFVARCLSMQRALDDRISMSRPNFDTLNVETYTFSNDVNLNFYKNNFYQVNWYEKNGIRFVIDDVVLCSINIQIYCIIKHILVQHNDSSICYFVCEKLNTENEIPHYRSFMVAFTNTHVFVKSDNVNCRPTIIHYLQELKLVKEITVL
ncbi:uncharacterized protein LOC116169372 isoform X1 [Photinus pyralis]|nr:uncharacterized protein LOC116169372 isoform X1 [Photinus pyralis]